MDRHAEFGHVRSSNSERIGIPALSALCIATTLRPFRATDVRADPHLLRQCRQKTPWILARTPASVAQGISCARI
jgi:hypothetical protein